MSNLVEGHLDLAIDDDSSSDEEFDTPDSLTQNIVRKAVSTQDDEGEELEVFGKDDAPSVAVSALPEESTIAVKEMQPEIEATSTLLSAMSAAVTALEKGFALPNSFHMEPTKPTEPVPPSADISNERDAFGISYKPFKKKENYELPKAPMFEDEIEFNASKAAAYLQATQTDANDDEFDFDASDVDGSTAVALAIGRVAQLSELEESDPCPTEVKSVAQAGLEAEPAEAKFDVRKAAKDSFNEIASIYGSGLGDIEVRLLDHDGAPLSTTATGTIGKPTLTATDTIEECDEDEVEREELAEEQRIQQEETAANTLASQLAAEFEALDDGKGAASDAATATEGADLRGDGVCHVADNDAMAALREFDYREFETVINVRNIDESGFRFSLVRPPELSFEGAEDSLKWPFLLAQVNYDPSIRIYRQMLQSIYFSLMPGETKCPIVGLHWDNIGFQGTDPCTDLNRSMKMLSVLQMIHFIDQQPALVRSLHSLSRYSNSFDPASIARGRKAAVAAAEARPRGAVDLTWPFMCVAINFTRESIQVLRSGALNKKINKRQAVLSVLHDFHHACFLDFAKRLVSNSAKHHAFHLAELSKSISSSPIAILKGYSKDMASGFPTPLLYPATTATRQNSVASSASSAARPGSDAPGKFDTLEEIEKKIESESNANEKTSFWSSFTGSKASKFKA